MAPERYWRTLPDGTLERVPGVTTVIGSSCGWGKEGLIRWAWGVGFDGKTLEDARRPACDTGTEVHRLIEVELKGGGEANFCDLEDQVRNGYASWQSWKRLHALSVDAVELKLVDEENGYGGKVDCVAHIGGKQCLLDWKTSNSVHEDYVVQLAAYGHLLGISGRHVQEYHLVRFNKHDGSFHHHRWSGETVEQAFDGFLAMLRLYNLQKILKKVV